MSLSVASSDASLGLPTAFEWDSDVENELLSTPLLMPELSSKVPTSSQSSYHQPARTDNPSLTFFNKFAKKVKRNSVIRRKGLTDELLCLRAIALHGIYESVFLSEARYKRDG